MAQQNDSQSPEPDSRQTSEPMAKTSSGPGAADKDAVADVTAPYGTRSRNRTGNSRPNYAEDKDIEIDMYDYYPEKRESDSSSGGGGKRSSRQSNAAGNGEATRGNGSSRRTAPDDTTKAASSQNGQRDQNSGGGTNASQATQGASTSQQSSSRKRKAAATAPASAAAATTATISQNTGSAVSTRRSASAAQNHEMAWSESNMLTFEHCKGLTEQGRMVADDGTVLEANDHVYLVCEPPGEPYYLGRIMEFLHVQNDSAKPVDAVRINWFYRPKDIGRKVQDTRLVFATMHSDISPLTALRGKCQIRHRLEVERMDEYRRTPDCFWYEKLYDRYIQKNYDLIPTRLIVNVPEKVKKVLDERWKYVLVEQGRGKELTSAVKLCKRCSGYCASKDSVDCAVCQHTYHMNCVKPPLLKKPSRGFAWSCAACSRAQERKLEARHTPNAIGHADADDDEFLDEDDEDVQGIETDRTSPADDSVPHQGTAEQIYHANLWPWRYLGMHCKPEDALDYDDRIYPRASTRIGPRHQATVSAWPGQPVQYVKPLETKKGGKKDQKLSKEAQAAQEAEKARRGQRPKWVLDQPPGYVARGEDLDENDPNCTATVLWKPPSSDDADPSIDSYMTKAMAMAKKLDLPERSTNLRDAAVESLFREDYDETEALTALAHKPRDEFKEPNLTSTEQKKFEEGVSKFGSELHLVMKHAKTMTPGEVVRYYYTWKKTERGQQVWGSFPGRKGKKLAKREEASRMADDVADDDDDSAFDTEKAAEKKRSFICQFCSKTKDRQWRRAPNSAPGLMNDNSIKANGKDKGANQYVAALCRTCAELWRRYAIRYEPLDDVTKKVAQAGGRAWKRKQDEELLRELQLAQEIGFMTPERAATPSSKASQQNDVHEPPRKKLKTAPPEREKDTDSTQSDGGSASGSVPPKRKEKEKEKEKEKVVPEPPPAPEMPKPQTLPCAICDQMEPMGDQHLSCRECRLTVHRNCYGVIDHKTQGKWVCDMCANDKSPQVSIQYKCVLCPVEYTEHDFVEQPKLTHHKKKMSEKDRERERMEVQQARKAAEYYRKKQEEMNRPVNPREPLKRTADNNWVHVTCAVWTPEVKFGNAKAMEPSEGIPLIPRSRYDETCQACKQQGGACVPCHQCRAPFHVECARQKGHVLGFDVTPVKGSRRDQFNIVTVNGESGTMSAVLWCKEHIPTKTIVHQMHDVANESGLNSLQVYVQNFKQADLTLTGTVRKATLMATAAKMSGAPVQPGHRRASSATTTTTPNGGPAQPRSGESTDAASNAQQPGDKVCITCGIDVTPRWWAIDNFQEQRRLTNGHHGTIGSEAQKFMEQRRFQCHKCHKLRKTPRSSLPNLLPGPSPPIPEISRPRGLETGLLNPAPLLRDSPPPPPLLDYRDGRHASHAHAWPQPPGSHPVPAASGPPPPPHHHHPPPPHPVQPPAHALVTGHRAAPVAHAYPPTGLPARTTPYNDWGHRPTSQHGSPPPPRHLNGGPPPLHNGPPPPAPAAIANLTSLRPPAMSGPPPAGPLPNGHHHGHSPQIYGNGLPPSPRRLSGPAPPAPYIPPFHAGVGHVNHGAPSHSTPHSLSNGAPLPPSRADAFSHGLHPQRTQYPGSHGSPPVSRNGLPPPHDPTVSSGSIGPRPPESRPATGASASPSLRNLLS